MSIVNRIFNGSLGITQAFLFDAWAGSAGGIAGAAASIAGSLISAHTQNKNTDKAIAAQREENERAYQRNIEQWERENDYNTPTAVAQRLRDAGMNPALAYGTPNVSSPSPTLNPTDMSAIANKRSVLGTALEAPLNAELIQAQIGVLKSEENKNNAAAGLTGAQTESQLTYNQYQDALLKGSLQEQDARISLNWAESELKDAQSMESYRNCDRILADIKEIYQNIKNKEREYEIMGEDLAIKTIVRRYEEPMKRAEITNLYSMAKMYNMTAAKTEEEFIQLAAQAEYNLAIKKTASNNMFLEGMNLSIENDLLNVDLSTSIYEREHLAGSTAIERISRLTGAYRDVTVGTGVFRGYSRKNSTEWTDTYDQQNNWTGRSVRKKRYD